MKSCYKVFMISVSIFSMEANKTMQGENGNNIFIIYF